MKKLTLLVTMMLIAAGSLMAQRSVVGKVTDASGEALPGATVLVKGTNNGTTSDDNGNFKVDVPANATRLSFLTPVSTRKRLSLGHLMWLM